MTTNVGIELATKAFTGQSVTVGARAKKESRRGTRKMTRFWVLQGKVVEPIAPNVELTQTVAHVIQSCPNSYVPGPHTSPQLHQTAP